MNEQLINIGGPVSKETCDELRRYGFILGEEVVGSTSNSRIYLDASLLVTREQKHKIDFDEEQKRQESQMLELQKREEESSKIDANLDLLIEPLNDFLSKPATWKRSSEFTSANIEARLNGGGFADLLYKSYLNRVKSEYALFIQENIDSALLEALNRTFGKLKVKKFIVDKLKEAFS